MNEQAMTDEALAALKARIDGGAAGGFTPGDAYAVIQFVVDDLIAARDQLRDLRAPNWRGEFGRPLGS